MRVGFPRGRWPSRWPSASLPRPRVSPRTSRARRWATPPGRGPACPRERATMRLGVLLDRFDPAAGGAEAHTDALMRRAVAEGEPVLLATLAGAGPPGVTTRRIDAARSRPARDRAFATVGEATLRAAGCDVVLAFRHALACDVYLPHGGLVED